MTVFLSLVFGTVLDNITVINVIMVYSEPGEISISMEFFAKTVNPLVPDVH